MNEPISVSNWWVIANNPLYSFLLGLKLSVTWIYLIFVVIYIISGKCILVHFEKLRHFDRPTLPHHEFSAYCKDMLYNLKNPKSAFQIRNVFLVSFTFLVVVLDIQTIFIGNRVPKNQKRGPFGLVYFSKFGPAWDSNLCFPARHRAQTRALTMKPCGNYFPALH